MPRPAEVLVHRLPPRHRRPTGPPHHQFRWRTWLPDRRPFNPRPAKSADGEVDLTSFAALTTQVDAPAMSEMLNHALTAGSVSLPDAVAMLDTAYLGHVIVLGSWALKQPNPEATASATVRFRSLDGRDREIAVPRLTFTEAIAGASA